MVANSKEVEDDKRAVRYKRERESLNGMGTQRGKSLM